MKKSTKHQNPTPSEAKEAFKFWMAGGKSIWDVKRKTGFKAKVLMPLFAKMLGKNEGAIRALQFRALGRLRKLLTSEVA